MRALRQSAVVLLVLASMAAISSCGFGTVRLPQDVAYSLSVDDETGWTIHELAAGIGTDREVRVKIAPDAGGNAFSFVVGGVELLRQPEKLGDLPGVRYGIPVLYPTPNRVRGAKFTFEGREFEFPANSRENHIHGLVHSMRWMAGDVELVEGGVRLPLVLDVKEDHPIWEFFPFDHRVEVAYLVTPAGLDVEVTVRNRDTRRLPFGFALHPYFRLLGERAATWIEVPARRHMEANRLSLLPTGVLRELDGLELDLREPRSLADLNLDDVYWGMDPERPARWEARDAGVAVTIEASGIFTHAVVYTPVGREFFCIESQTCSTDAHNLYAAGHSEAAHLLILEPVAGPGSSVEGSVRFRVGAPAEVAGVALGARRR